MSGKNHIEERNGGRFPKTLWAYGYEIIPPQGDDLMKEIETLLLEEHKHARRKKRVWAGKMIREPRVTHIMVVCDSPDQTLQVNHRLESRLMSLKAGYSLSAPMAVLDDDPAQPPAPDIPGGPDL